MDQIRAQLLAATPAFVGRIAGIELQVAYHVHHGLPLPPGMLEELTNNAGIYAPTRESLEAYVQRLLMAYAHCTLIAEWDRNGPVYQITGKGQELIQRMVPSHRVPRIDALALEPYYAKQVEEGWMPALKGKRVLVVHPFVHTLRSQLERHAQPFGPKWLEGCTCHVLAPPQTIAGNHHGVDWQTHLADFLLRLDHSLETLPRPEVAFVAAGGYGMLIADELHLRGISVLYIGGALQLFFGIIGRRWFTNPTILHAMDEFEDGWTRPLAADQPTGKERVERGCYW